MGSNHLTPHLTPGEKYFLSGLVGVIAGEGLVFDLDAITSPVWRVRFIEKEDMPRIMKVYTYTSADHKNKYERNLKKAKIKLLVSQTENKK